MTIPLQHKVDWSGTLPIYPGLPLGIYIWWFPWGFHGYSRRWNSIVVDFVLQKSVCLENLLAKSSWFWMRVWTFINPFCWKTIYHALLNVEFGRSTHYDHSCITYLMMSRLAHAYMHSYSHTFDLPTEVRTWSTHVLYIPHQLKVALVSPLFKLNSPQR